MVHGFLESGHETKLIGLSSGISLTTAFPSLNSFYGLATSETPATALFPAKSRHLVSVRMALTAWLYKPELCVGRNIPALFFTAIVGLPTVTEVHDLAHTTRWTRGLLFLSQYASGFRGVVVTTTNMQSYLSEKLSIPTNKILVCPNGASDTGKTLKARPAGEPVKVGYAGSFSPGKGIEVLQYLSSRFQELEFCLAGDLEPVSESQRRYLHDAPNVSLFETLSPSEVGAFLLDMDVLLMPSMPRMWKLDPSQDFGRYHSPLKLFEYMAAGRAIIASKVSGAEAVYCASPPNMILCNPLDMEEWEESLRALASNRRRRNQLGKNAFESLRLHYSWSVRAQKILNWLNQDDSRGKKQAGA